MGARAVCISHGEDADGLICAAYLARLREATAVLVSYDDFEGALKRVLPPVKELYVCDLNIREELREEILRIGEFAEVTIVDHHPTAEEILDELGTKVTVIYSPLDFASALLYDRFGGSLGREWARLAAYAAISDQFEEGPIAARLLNMFDRHFVQHEALILSHALSRENASDFRLSVVEGLRRLVLPHRMKGVVDTALGHLEEIATLIESLPTRASRRRRLAWVEASPGMSLGTIANLLLDSMDVDVGVSHRKAGDGRVTVSVRCRRGLPLHLGEATKRIAERRGGFGGGHSRASGASIPLGSLRGFIDDLEGEFNEGEKP